ncbi:MAG: PrgI family protein [bacterium]
MASYQVPQFLDSGDKIIGPLNLRQFGYALFGFLVCMVVFTITSNIAPQLGIYAFLPASPIAILAAYMALGKYNGRDSDVYLLKLILYTLKPRLMAYRRLAYVDDLNEKATQFTYQKIETRWKEEAAKKLPGAGNELREFYSEEAKAKADRIRRLGTLVDINVTNTLAQVEQKELEIKSKEALLQNLVHSKKPGKNPWTPIPVPEIPSASVNPKEVFQPNFFQGKDDLDQQ